MAYMQNYDHRATQELRFAKNRMDVGGLDHKCEFLQGGKLQNVKI